VASTSSRISILRELKNLKIYLEEYEAVQHVRNGTNTVQLRNRSTFRKPPISPIQELLCCSQHYLASIICQSYGFTSKGSLDRCHWEWSTKPAGKQYIFNCYEAIKWSGFKLCKSYSSVYVAKNNEDIVYLVLYVDDGLIISWSSFNIFWRKLLINFRSLVISLLHSTVIQDMLNKFNLIGCKPNGIPIQKKITIYVYWIHATHDGLIEN